MNSVDTLAEHLGVTPEDVIRDAIRDKHFSNGKEVIDYRVRAWQCTHSVPWYIAQYAERRLQEMGALSGGSLVGFRRATYTSRRPPRF